MRVALITTGQMERTGLPEVLAGLFPGHVFDAVERVPGEPFAGFTSYKVEPPADDGRRQAVDLVRAALDALAPGDSSSPVADLALILDDLEVENVGNEDVVVDHMHQSVLRAVQETRPPADPVKLARLLRERASFHLAAPMPEAWFFGDLASLPALIAPERSAAIPKDRFRSVVRPGADPERFSAIDQDYSRDDGAACAAATKGPKPRRAPWVMARREEHPKRYVQWLLRDPQAAACHWYMESQDGVRMLHHLAWSKVLDQPAAFTYLRALVRDLEDALGTRAVGIPEGGEEAALTSVSTSRASPVLRNI